MSGAGTAVCGVAIAGGVVNFNSRLVVVAIHMEAHAITAVLHRPGFHLHPLGHQIVAAENGGHPVQHMVAGLLYVIGHQVLKGQHTLGVQVAGAGDQIAGVGILRRQLVADQMTAVIQVLAVHRVIFHRVPAAGPHLADLASLFRGHSLLAQAGKGHPTAPQTVQRRIGLIGRSALFVLGTKARLVVVQHHVGLSAKGRYIRRGLLFLSSGLGFCGAGGLLCRGAGRGLYRGLRHRRRSLPCRGARLAAAQLTQGEDRREHRRLYHP